MQTIGKRVRINGQVYTVAKSVFSVDIGRATSEMRGLMEISWKQQSTSELVLGPQGVLGVGGGAWSPQGGSITLLLTAFNDLCSALRERSLVTTGVSQVIDVPFGVSIDFMAPESVIGVSTSNITLPEISIKSDEPGGMAEGDLGVTVKMEFLLLKPVLYDGASLYVDPTNPSNPLSLAEQLRNAIGG